MSKGIVLKVTLSLLLFLLIEGYPLIAQEQPVRIMFYNVENMFDTVNDTLTDDDEFLPAGTRRWNNKRYRSKVNSVYKTIIAAGEWSPPAIVSFCEIENRKVLEDLVYGTYLSKYNYRIVHEDSPDPRGIDVCLIYRSDLIDVINYQYFIPYYTKRSKLATRSVLYTKCLISGDTIHLFVNHWPSRRGGVLAGESQRKQIAEMVKLKIDSILNSRVTETKIMIIGDFNSTPDDLAVGLFTSKNDKGLSMVNLSENLTDRYGTYKYTGIWEMIDQLIVSDALINCSKGVYTEPGKLRIFNPDFLLKKDPKYPGMSPFSTWSGYRYQGGYSDHLPIIIDLAVK
jgi:hypothetical protein